MAVALGMALMVAFLPQTALADDPSVTLVPNGDTARIEWSSTNASHYEAVDEGISPSDGDNTTVYTSESLKVDRFELNSTSGIGKCTAVNVTVRCRTNGTLTLYVRLSKSDDTTIDTTRSASVTNASYANKQYNFTGLDLSQADVNGMRVEVMPYFTAAGTVWVTAIEVVVTYSTATWQSYSNSNHTTQCDNFSDYATEHIAYMHGEGFATNASYRVIFWDLDNGTWYKRGIEDPDSDGSGNLSAAHTFNVTTDTDGDWHCTVYDSQTYDPSTYDSGDSQIVADDTSYTGGYAFHVEASAIPEFPTVVAGIGVAGLCFGIYYWMRKKSLKFRMQSSK